MVIDFDKLSSSQAYFTMTQAIIPRPIAWVLSDHGNGKLNLAPFSYFNAVCSRPPMQSISIGHKKSGLKKDTWVNIEGRYKHVDNHAVAFHPTDKDFLLVGCDGGVYRSYDYCKTWLFCKEK